MEHRSLLDDIAGFTEGVAEGPVEMQEPRRASRNGDFFHESQTDRRHAPGFYFSGEQSHGPRADGSGGHQKSQINPRPAYAPRDLLHRRQEPLRAAHQAESVVVPGQAPYGSLRLELPQALDRKDEVDVAERVRSVVGLV